MDERVRFIAAVTTGEWSMTALCEEFGISRKTGYKWVGRYREEGAAGLAERSRAPLTPGRTTPTHLVEAIVGLRRARPSWGPRKIMAKLGAGAPEAPWPSASTAGEILKRAGLVSQRRLHRRGPPRLGELTAPERCNHVWGVDHKGWVRLGDGARVEPLTITDGFSRYLLCAAPSTATTHAQARPLFERAFAEHGLPDVIRSDNGTPFASTGVTGLTALGVWWIKLGIAHERIDPGHPQQNGRHERMHLTLLEAMRPPARDLGEQARRLSAFVRDYNEERPHEALGQKPPASVYAPSSRQPPDRLPEPDYPAEAAVRKVRSSGEIKWRGDLVFVSTALVDEAIALEETEAGEIAVRFFDVRLGVIDRKTGKLRRPEAPARKAAASDAQE
ncbi:MAG TPA: IS481 family transposase [Roseiarcus sp.]|nr:IS481 family transposase [Roseiarcus sp.]